MQAAVDKFMQAVLGEAGALALARAASRFPDLAYAAVPRAVCSWVEVASTLPYDGLVPGCGARVTLSKSEKGLAGSVDVDGELYRFEGASIAHAASAVAVAARIELGPQEVDVDAPDLARLGKNLDLLVRAREATRMAKAASGESCGRCREPLDQRGRCRVLSHFQMQLSKGERGLISPRGKFYPIKQDENHYDWIAKKFQQNSPSWEDRNKFYRQKIKEGWIGFGVGEQAALVAHPTVINNVAHPATRMARQMASDWDEDQFEYIDPESDSYTTAPTRDFRTGRWTYELKKKGPEPQGQAAKPLAPVEPEQPQATQAGGILPKKQKPQGPRVSGLPTLKSEAAHSGRLLRVADQSWGSSCSACGEPQTKGASYVGCACFSALAKSVSVSRLRGGYELRFGAGWDEDSVEALAAAFGGE